MDISEACKDSSFFLKEQDGEIHLKQNHNYSYQVQGQMYVTGLKWIDFVVWFGNGKNIFVECIYFDEESGSEIVCPTLICFISGLYFLSCSLGESNVNSHCFHRMNGNCSKLN